MDRKGDRETGEGGEKDENRTEGSAEESYVKEDRQRREHRREETAERGGETKHTQINKDGYRDVSLE